MEAKKNKQADLEKRKGMFIEVGLVVALSLVLIGFEWAKGPDKGDNTEMVQEIQFEDEMMQITRREEPKPEPKPEQPKVAEVLDIVDDDVEISFVRFLGQQGGHRQLWPETMTSTRL